MCATAFPQRAEPHIDGGRLRSPDSPRPGTQLGCLLCFGIAALQGSSSRFCAFSPDLHEIENVIWISILATWLGGGGDGPCPPPAWQLRLELSSASFWAAGAPAPGWARRRVCARNPSAGIKSQTLHINPVILPSCGKWFGHPSQCQGNVTALVARRSWWEGRWHLSVSSAGGKWGGGQDGF